MKHSSQAALFASLPPHLRAINASLNPLARHAVTAAPEARDAIVAEHDRRARAVVAGRNANASGEAFEAWVEAQHEAAKLTGLLARVDHFGPRVVFVGGGECRVVGLAPPDYIGTLRGGRTLAVEAKHRGGRLKIGGDDRDAIAPHQVKYLSEVGNAGALALLVVGFTRANGETRFAVPWSVAVKAAKAVKGDGRNARAGVLTLGPEDLAGWEARSPHYLVRFVGG